MLFYAPNNERFPFGIYSGFQANPTGKYQLNVKGPALYLVGPYKISGRVLVLPIQGEGNSNITLGNGLNINSSNDILVDSLQSFLFCFYHSSVEPELTMTFDGKSVKRNNNEYLGIENAKLTFKVKR